MDVISLVSLIQSKKSGGGGSDFPVNDFFAGTCKELTLTGLTEMKDHSIYTQSNLERLSLGVEKIMTYAIYNCANLTEINLLEGLKTIESMGIMQCGKISSIVLPSTLQSLGYSSLTGCSGLKTVTFLGKPTEIGSMFNSTALPSSVETINCPWSEGEVAGAPFGATSAQINYNYTGG
jgi:hypothetical protein